MFKTEKLADFRGRHSRWPPLPNLLYFHSFFGKVYCVIGWRPLGNPGYATANSNMELKSSEYKLLDSVAISLAKSLLFRAR